MLYTSPFPLPCAWRGRPHYMYTEISELRPGADVLPCEGAGRGANRPAPAQFRLSFGLVELGEDGLLQSHQLRAPLVEGLVLLGVARLLVEQQQLLELVDVPVDLPVEDERHQQRLDLEIHRAAGWARGLQAGHAGLQAGHVGL